MNRVLRLVAYGVLGYFFGFTLGRCAAAAEIVHLNSHNTVTFRGEVSEGSVIAAQLQIAELVKARGSASYPIYLVLDSPGGDVVAGLSFIESTKNIPNLRTISIFAASMASGIVEGLPGSRLITANGQLMFHRAAGSFQGQFETGELESQVAAAKELIRGLEEQNAARLQISLEVYKAKILNQYWLSAKAAVADKAADKIVDIVCSTELIDARIGVEVDFMFGTKTFEFSGCPTFRFPLPTKKNAKELVGL